MMDNLIDHKNKNKRETTLCPLSLSGNSAGIWAEIVTPRDSHSRMFSCKSIATATNVTGSQGICRNGLTAATEELSLALFTLSTSASMSEFEDMDLDRTWA